MFREYLANTIGPYLTEISSSSTTEVITPVAINLQSALFLSTLHRSPAMSLVEKNHFV
jgi:hypothetical protein